MPLHIKIKKSNHKNELLESILQEGFSISDIFDTNYISKKLHEILIKFVPKLNDASKLIIDICTTIIKIVYSRFFNVEDKKVNEGILDSLGNASDIVKNMFDSIYDFLKKLFNEENQTENITVINLSAISELTADFSKNVSVDSQAIEFEIFQHIKDNIKEKDSQFLLIKENDLNSINMICQLNETKLFTVKEENNYLCLPFNDENFKGFKAININQYYKNYYHVSDEEYLELVEITSQFYNYAKKNNFKITAPPMKINFKDLSIVFRKYTEAEKGWGINFEGYFSEENKQIIIANLGGDKCIEFFEKGKMLSTLIHEFIHCKDALLNKNELTNMDVQDIMNKIYELHKEDVSVDLKSLQKELKINNESVFRYLIAILQKHRYIDYLQNDYTKIKIMLDNPLGSVGNDSIDKSTGEEKSNYFNSANELNTWMSNALHLFIRKTKKDLLSTIQKKYITDNLSNDQNLDNFINTFILNNEDVIREIAHLATTYISEPYERQNNKDIDNISQNNMLAHGLNNRRFIGIRNNYFKKIQEQLPTTIKQFIKKEIKDLKDKEFKTASIKKDSKNNEKELQTNSLLRQYISLLIT